MTDVDVLIIIEHKSRELESACLLKMEFENRGYSAKIVGIYPNKEELSMKYRAKIIISPWVYTGTKYIYPFLKYSPDAVLVNMHHEQYGIENDKSLFPMGRAQKVFHISWGYKFTNDLIKVGCNPERIFTIGNIRLDVLKSPLNKVLRNRKDLSNEFGINSSKKWILIIGDGGALIEDYQWKKLDEISKETQKTATRCRSDMLRYIDQYLATHDDTVFIYRPHPSYANKELVLDDIENLRKKYPGLFWVIYKYPLNSWINSVDTCMSFISTSIVECFFANTPYYLFRTFDLEEAGDIEFLHQYKYRIKDYDSFVNALNDKHFNFDYIRNVLEYYYILDNEYTFKRAVDCICNIGDVTLNIEISKEELFCNFFKAKIKEAVVYFSHMNFLRSIMEWSGDNRLYRLIDEHFDIIHEEEINYLVDLYKRCFEDV